MSQSPVYLEELPYDPDSCGLFERIRDLPGALLLDSSHPHSRAGRFDILTADPFERFDFATTDSDCEQELQASFKALAAQHRTLFGDSTAPSEDLPFCGGFAGYLDYDLGRPLQHMEARNEAGGRLNAYRWSIVQDHLLRKCTFAALPAFDHRARSALIERLREPASSRTSSVFQLQQPFSCNLDQNAYRERFQTIQSYILSGDCYQVNLARRFSSTYQGDPWDAYLRLRPLAAAPFASYLNHDDGRHLLCLSPERFLSLYGSHVETRPIKGTRPRQRDPRSDALAADELRTSAKDRAENLMIVDLLRNDIGRSCTPGSIHVERLFELESYPTVHHLVSTISGELLPDRSAFDLLRDSFPGGSITGAPKRRAMQIIDELEPNSRQAYCGSLLYVSAHGRMDSNIAIRSLVCDNGEIHCWGGGGLVADSDCDREYQETWDKVGRFINELENDVQ